MKIFLFIFLLYLFINIFLFFKVDKPTVKSLLQIIFFGPWLFYLKSKTKKIEKRSYFSINNE